MKVVNINDLNPGVDIVSIGDTAMLLNLMYHDLVDEILESFINLTDVEIIREIIDTLGLSLTCVVENDCHGLLIHGYIHHGGVPV